MGSVAILTRLILPIQEHGISITFLESSLISFINFYSPQHTSLSPSCSGLLLSILFIYLVQGVGGNSPLNKNIR